MTQETQEASLLDVSVVTPQKVLFEGKVQSVILPGEKGIFEVLINHKPLLSLLIIGDIIVDTQSIPIRRGIVRAIKNQVLAIVEGTSH